MDGNILPFSWMLNCALLSWLYDGIPLACRPCREPWGLQVLPANPKRAFVCLRCWACPSSCLQFGELKSEGWSRVQPFRHRGEVGAVNCTLGLSTYAPLKFYFSWSKCFFGPRPTLSLLCSWWPVYIVVALLGIKSFLSLICFEHLKVLKMISAIQGNWFEEEIIQSCFLFPKCLCASLWILYMTWLAVPQHSLLIRLV